MTPVAAPVTAAPAVAAAPAPRTPWYGRRLPLVVTAAALVLGCLCGGGAVAIAAFVGDGHRGGERITHSPRDGRDARPDRPGMPGGYGDGRGGYGDGPGRPGGRDGRPNPPVPAPPAPTGSAPAAPTPSASA